MKCISTRQPWADLIVGGVRPFETKDFEPRCAALPFPLLIHASLEIDWAACRRLGMLPPGVTGAVLGMVDFVRVTRPSAAEWRKLWLEHLEANGRPYGDKTRLWFFENRRRFSEPVPFKGQLGLFDVPDELVQKYLAA